MAVMLWSRCTHIKINVVTQINHTFSPLPNKNNCALYKCTEIKSRGCCYYAIVTFCTSAHTVYNSLFRNIQPYTVVYLRRMFSCDSNLAALFELKRVNLGYACGKLTKPTCVGCISLQQHNVSLGFHWWNWYPDNLMCLQ